jgi:hypothetical protein
MKRTMLALATVAMLMFTAENVSAAPHHGGYHGGSYGGYHGGSYGGYHGGYYGGNHSHYGAYYGLGGPGVYYSTRVGNSGYLSIGVGGGWGGYGYPAYGGYYSTPGYYYGAPVYASPYYYSYPSYGWGW